MASSCSHDPMMHLGKAMGMYHCPECGEMVVAGVPHPEYADDPMPWYQIDEDIALLSGAGWGTVRIELKDGLWWCSFQGAEGLETASGDTPSHALGAAADRFRQIPGPYDHLTDQLPF